jgi:DNA polymerase III epsilon subunit family exonuclease
MRLPRPVLRRSVSGLWKTRRSGRIRLDQARRGRSGPGSPEPAAPPSDAPRPTGPGVLDRVPAGLLTGADLVVVDVETTGWLADSASITEIGAVRLACDQPAREFSVLVNPGTPIPPDIMKLTGITDDMVAGAPPIGEVLPRFIEFAHGSVMVAHNAPFDLGFLTAACADNGIGWPPCAVIDTAVLARLVLSPGAVPDHKLTTLADYFGTGTDPCHRALADARATAGVLGGLLSLAVRYDCAASGPDNGERDSTAKAPAIQEAAMVTAIVLIKADVTRIPQTAEAIAQISEVSEVYSVTGEFDLVAMVRVRGHDELDDVIPGRLNRVPGVTHTETHIAFRTYSRHDLDAAFSIGYPNQS